MNLKKLTAAIIIAGVTSHASATGQGSQASQIDHEGSGTYWGLGIGTVIGAALAGPPGAGIGAALGGAFGWGHEQEEALLDSHEVLQKTQSELSGMQRQLHSREQELLQSRQQLASLMEENAEQTARLSELLSNDMGDGDGAQEDLLQGLAEHYIQEVYFKKGQYALPEYARQRLESLAALMQQHPRLTVTLTGFTDRSGNPAFNQKLALLRATEVQGLLIDKGVAPERVRIAATGEQLSQVSAGDEANYILDRRVALALSMEEPASHPVAANPDQGVAAAPSVSQTGQILSDANDVLSVKEGL
ncbi:MAG: OmpA family protein [Oleiphilaceae bacterium]|nr:OmpA family protein [Oleiphilaceae bacterium]